MLQTIPKLKNGDRLTRVEFERRYSAMPNTKAELIDGVVFVASPLSNKHAGLHAMLIAWLGAYVRRHPELRVRDNATARLDEDNEPQPDACVVRRDHPEEDGYLKGVPMLVAEAAYSSAAYDLHQKKEVYRRYRCAEYLVAVEHSQEVFWFRNVEGQFIAIEPDKHGVFASVHFPGLELDSKALFAEDMDRLISRVEKALKKKPRRRTT